MCVCVYVAQSVHLCFSVCLMCEERERIVHCVCMFSVCVLGVCMCTCVHTYIRT